MDAAEPGQRALGAHQQSGEVGVLLRQLVDVVAADTPQQLRETRLDFRGLALAQGQQLCDQ